MSGTALQLFYELFYEHFYVDFVVDFAAFGLRHYVTVLGLFDQTSSVFDQTCLEQCLEQCIKHT